MVDSAEGAIFLATFGTWNISPESAGILLWDANVDLVKRNHCISGSDEDKLQSEPSISRRNFAREKRRVGGYMNTDMDIQTIRYWAGRVKDNQILYTAQTLKGAKTADEINTLIEAGKLPKEAQLDTETVENIVSEWYQKSVNRMLDKEDVTLRAIMKLPLTSLEVDSSTVQVLSTPFFSNRAVDDKTIGKTRFELMKEGNPQLDDTYARTYLKVQSLYTNELLNFTHEVLRQVNNASSEKLFDDKGNYTEYGESVVNIIGKDIVKYALLKAIGGKNFKTKIDEETGVIHYNYAKLRDNTSLKSLGINDQTPEEEALHLQRIIKRGLDDLTKEDAKFESHRNYIDIQYMIEGNEKVGVTDLSNCSTCIEYDITKDLEFHDVNCDEEYLELNEGQFLVLYPNDAHKPSISKNKKTTVKKVVVKVAV